MQRACWVVATVAPLLACGGQGSTIHGSVIVDGTPEPAATVVLTGPARRDTVTDSVGRFELDGLPEGRYGLSVSVAATVEVRQAQTLVVPHVDDGPLVIPFTPAGTLAGGVILDERVEGTQSVEGVAIKIARPPREATTDQTGTFRFDRVPVGEHQLSAVGAGVVTEQPIAATVTRGHSTGVVLTLVSGRPPEPPGNQQPVIGEDVGMTLLDEVDESPRPLRPPSVSMVRGQTALLTCNATDPDGDPLHYVWSASSGNLVAGSEPNALITAAKEDIGVSCSVLDGRGGVDSRDLVIPVHDPYFGGACLIAEGAFFSNAYDDDFDLVVWTETGARTRTPMPGAQWLPDARGSFVAFEDRQTGGRALMWGTLDMTGAGLTPAGVVTHDFRDFVATDVGVVWIDGGGRVWSKPGAQAAMLLESEALDRVAFGGSIVAVETDLDRVTLRHLSGALVGVVETPQREGNSFATDGHRVAYWAAGKPMLAAEGQTPVELGPESIWNTGRILVDGSWAAYSAYRSPIEFVEATVVALDDNRVLGRERVGVGPTEVLDLEGDRLLIGRPRAVEAEPSAELWLHDLSNMEVVP
ncbi:carboxypeptidase regulatory-like domain-containing protein [Myxococcota bacterium]